MQQQQAKQAKPVLTRVDFHNPKPEAIRFTMKNHPTDEAELITVEPGETYKGFPNYTNFYKRQGLLPGKAPSAAKVVEQAAKDAKEAARMRQQALAEREAAEAELAEAKRIAAEAELASATAKAAAAGVMSAIPADDTKKVTKGK